ncbi:unnamed protein product [Ceratitis capitata]|uniref:(Mediterranean fruit fly) hypothetical protein n=1 Tax=Ceratitis capitata TaxID=7213 RepID=A0A811UG92_CERCA|nr:unnamed protein product [Ceratitis capitata]
MRNYRKQLRGPDKCIGRATIADDGGCVAACKSIYDVAHTTVEAASSDNNNISIHKMAALPLLFCAHGRARLLYAAIELLCYASLTILRPAEIINKYPPHCMRAYATNIFANRMPHWRNEQAKFAYKFENETNWQSYVEQPRSVTRQQRTVRLGAAVWTHCTPLRTYSTSVNEYETEMSLS